MAVLVTSSTRREVEWNETKQKTLNSHHPTRRMKTSSNPALRPGNHTNKHFVKQYPGEINTRALVDRAITHNARRGLDAVQR